MFFDIGLNKSNQLPTGAIAEIEKKRDENKFFFKLTYSCTKLYNYAIFYANI